MPSLFINFDQINDRSVTEARLHPAQDATGPRPKTMFLESRQEHNEHSVRSSVGVSHYEKVVCSIDLTQLYAKLPINKINLKGFLDEHLVWELPIDPLKDNQHQCFLQSPTFPLSSVSGKISIKLAVYYNHSILDCSHRDGDSSQQDCDFSQQDEPTEYTIVFEYWRLRGKPPIAFELMSSQGKIYRPRVEEDIKQSAGEEAYVWIPTKRKRDRGDIFSNGPTRPRRDLGSVRRTIKRMPLRLTGKADRRAPLPVEGGLAEEAAKDGKHDATST